MPLMHHKASCCRIEPHDGHPGALCQTLAKQILAKQLCKRTAVRFATPSTARPSKVFRLVPVFRSSKTLGQNKALASTRTNQWEPFLTQAHFTKVVLWVSRNWEQIPIFGWKKAAEEVSGEQRIRKEAADQVSQHVMRTTVARQCTDVSQSCYHGAFGGRSLSGVVSLETHILW